MLADLFNSPHGKIQQSLSGTTSAAAAVPRLAAGAGPSTGVTEARRPVW